MKNENKRVAHGSILILLLTGFSLLVISPVGFAEVVNVKEFVSAEDEKNGDIHARSIIEALKRAGEGDTVRLSPDTTYFFKTGKIHLNKKGITLDGKNSTLAFKGGNDRKRVMMSIVEPDVTVKNLTLNGSGKKGGGIAIGSSGVRIRNCTIGNTEIWGIVVSNSNGHDLTFINNEIHHTNNGIAWQPDVHASGYRIRNNHIHHVNNGLQINTPGAGTEKTYGRKGPQREYLSKGGSSKYWIIDNLIEHTGFYSSDLWTGFGIALSRASNVIIRGNRLLDNPRQALHIEAFCHDIDCSYNYMESGQTGIQINYGREDPMPFIAREHKDKIEGEEGTDFYYHAVHGPKFNMHFAGNEIYAGERGVYVYTKPDRYDPRTGTPRPLYNWYVHDNRIEAEPELVETICPSLKTHEGRPREPMGWGHNRVPITNLCWENNEVSSFEYVNRHGKQERDGTHKWFDRHTFFQSYLKKADQEPRGD